MKQLPIILFVCVTNICNAQMPALFESYFQIFKTDLPVKREIKIYHTPMIVNIQPSSIDITVKMTDGSCSTVFNRSVVWRKASDFFIHQDQDLMINYWPTSKKVWIVQNKSEQEFFGELPQSTTLDCDK